MENFPPLETLTATLLKHHRRVLYGFIGQLRVNLTGKHFVVQFYIEPLRAPPVGQPKNPNSTVESTRVTPLLGRKKDQILNPLWFFDYSFGRTVKGSNVYGTLKHFVSLSERVPNTYTSEVF